MASKLTIADARALALQRGGSCLSETYTNNHTRMLWQCASGHQWKSSYRHVQSGRWCSECRKQNREKKHSAARLAECYEAAARHGGKCLSTESLRAKDLVTWQCKKGHKWCAVPASVIGQNTWCPICAGNTKLSLNQMSELAESRGGQCLSQKYFNIDTKYLWRCSLGHEWQATFNKIRSGQWCPTCSKSGISEEVCRTTFEQLFNVKFPKCRPQWLRNSRGFQMEIDGCNYKLGVGFEYHGKQHFEVVTIFHANEGDLIRRQEDDALKGRLCADHGIKLFVIDYQINYEDFPNEIERQAKELDVDLSGIDLSKSVDLSKAHVRVDRIGELRELIIRKNGLLLSNKWLGVKHYYRVKCQKDGNEWSASGSELLKGAWCKQCAMRKLQKKQMGSINEVHSFAVNHGGLLLSSKYKGAAGKYDFKCAEGHVFSAKLSNLKTRNQWCPICERRQVKGMFPAYEDAAKFVRQLELKTVDDWNRYLQGSIPGHAPKPYWIPSKPDAAYKDKGWKGWGDWLGTGTIANQDKKFRSFSEARYFSRKLGLRSQAEWRMYAQGKLEGLEPRPDDIPAAPYGTYREKGWVSWPDWLGKT